MLHVAPEPGHGLPRNGAQQWHEAGWYPPASPSLPPCLRCPPSCIPHNDSQPSFLSPKTVPSPTQAPRCAFSELETDRKATLRLTCPHFLFFFSLTAIPSYQPRHVVVHHALVCRDMGVQHDMVVASRHPVPGNNPLSCLLLCCPFRSGSTKKSWEPCSCSKRGQAPQSNPAPAPSQATMQRAHLNQNLVRKWMPLQAPVTMTSQETVPTPTLMMPIHYWQRHPCTVVPLTVQKRVSFPGQPLTPVRSPIPALPRISSRQLLALRPSRLILVAVYQTKKVL